MAWPRIIREIADTARGEVDFLRAALAAGEQNETVETRRPLDRLAHSFENASDAYLHRLGCVEVLEEELPYKEDIRSSAFFMAALLRGETAAALPESYQRPAFSDADIGLLRDYLADPSDANLAPLVELLERLTGADTAFLRIYSAGVIRRQLTVPTRQNRLRAILENTGSDDELEHILSFLCFEIETYRSNHEDAGSELEAQPPRHNILVLTHLGQFRADGVADQIKHSEQKQSRRLSALLTGRPLTARAVQLTNLAMGSLSMPNLGSAVVSSELRQHAIRGTIDYVDITDQTRLTEILTGELVYDTVLISANSYDVSRVQELTPAFRARGAHVIVGGLAASLDAAAVRESGASVFSGEIEQMGQGLLYLMQADEQVHIHRECPPTDMVSTETIEHIPPLGICISFTDEDGCKHIYMISRDDFRDRLLDVRQSYQSRHEATSQQLRHRLEALNRMTPYIRVGDRLYESSGRIYVHCISMVRGCPWRCDMCSTVETEGQRMRRRSPESIDQELRSVETQIVVAVGQNVFAKGTAEKDDDWLDYWHEVLSIYRNQGKKLAMQTELAAFQRMREGATAKVHQAHEMLDQAEDMSLAPSYRAILRGQGQALLDKWQDFDELIKSVVFAALSGLEHPVQIRGAGTKRPEQYREQLRIARELSIPILGTVVAGLPAELIGRQRAEVESYIPYETLEDREYAQVLKKWQRWIGQLEDVYAVMWLPFAVIKGAPGYDRLVSEGIIAPGEQGYYQEIAEKDRIEGIRLAKDLIAEFYNLRRTTLRIMKAIFIYRPKRLLFIALVNFGFLAVRSFGEDPGRSIAHITDAESALVNKNASGQAEASE